MGTGQTWPVFNTLSLLKHDSSYSLVLAPDASLGCALILFTYAGAVGLILLPH
jgi:hypothetical protein